MTPRILFPESFATHFDEDGFVAGDHQSWLRMLPPRNPSEDQELFNALAGDLDWSNKTASPFISAYADLDTAVNSAISLLPGQIRAREGFWSLSSTLEVVKTYRTGMCQESTAHTIQPPSALSHSLATPFTNSTRPSPSTP